MNIAVLSGKGGTGKTFISVNLASVIPDSCYIDCDIEEPNGHLFFKPENEISEDVFVSLPSFDSEKCTGCRTCVDFCRFNALAFIREKPFLFKDVCHSCGGCSLFCPTGAVTEENHQIGKIIKGNHKSTTTYTGILNIGEESGVPVIKKLLTKLSDGTNIIDCPPGSACSVTESIQDSDFCIIVAEPTVFGVHNFMMVHELVNLMKKPFGVIINKYDTTDNPMEKLCRENNIPVIERIAFCRELAGLCANGEIITEKLPEYKKLFLKIYDTVQKEVCS